MARLIRRCFIPDLHKLSTAPDTFWGKSALYVVVAERWSDPSNHCYPVGVYRTLDCALHNANKEVAHRGGKYGARVYVTRHPNNKKPERLVELYEISSPYKGRARNNLV